MTKDHPRRRSSKIPSVRGLLGGSKVGPIVGIGASAGGLDACKKLFDAMSANSGLACILVQHLDPSHDSMMVELLASHTSMVVLDAADGMPVERNHLYIIKPGTYLSIVNDTLHVSEPQARRGVRLPFDFLAHSLAESYGPRAIVVILSGTGADGSLGLRAIKARGGLVIAQDPAEAGYDGMPRNAIATGGVDLVLSAAEIPAALMAYDWQAAVSHQQNVGLQTAEASSGLAGIIDFVRHKTAHDFTFYKPGTLERRVERRMAIAAVEPRNMARYLEVLQNDAAELDLLAKDLLINVTNFFRDPKVFIFLAEKTIPDLIRSHTPGQPLRIWVAGCSTGEETYSLTMIFREKIAEAKLNIRLQIFASDVDPDAVAEAREGYYPKSIEEDVSPERLDRFFTRESDGYRVSPELRALVVFTVQDVLADPPFSRLDLVSCRNLLIYLRPEAQAKVLALFHFALRENGILVLGNSEAVGNADDRFAVIAKSERIYRHIGRARPGELGFLMGTGDGMRAPMRLGQGPAPTRQAALAELCRRLVMETFAPAAVLINRKQECLYFLGPTDRYLRVAPGHPTLDLLGMARPEIRTKLRSAIQHASQQHARVTATGGRISHDDQMHLFSIDVQPVSSDGEELLLICFVEEPKQMLSRNRPVANQDAPGLAELEEELMATRTELQRAIRNLEISSDEQKAINEETLSVNEEFQSTNEELLTSKEELQSLNEELTALNSQLQETLERQRTTSNDLQNVLYSTDVATLFLDTDLNIRFFTPATKSLFNIISGDVGRPLADLNSLAADSALLTDARAVLTDFVPVEREIRARNGIWYVRRILPYRAQDNSIEGVVITFVDITERKRVADALSVAKAQAEQANIAKSRFLAVASHDLRQPLQSLVLLQGLLAKVVDGDKGRNLVGRLDETLGAMSGMLNALLDINQIEAGTVHPDITTFPINDMLSRLRDEFAYHAQAKGLVLHVVPCGLSIESDPHLLEQMVRNLLNNALKYTKRGKVLLGCRRHAGRLTIEIWDTGIGIPASDIDVIFEEYRQLDNATRERSRGLGLGLSIVQRLGVLMGHQVVVRSQVGRGSVFTIDVPIVPGAKPAYVDHAQHGPMEAVADIAHRSGTILIVEDDPELRDLIALLLQEENYRVVAAPDGIAALDLIARDALRPDLFVTDQNLPNGLNGYELTMKLREVLRDDIPAIILTGDIATGLLRDGAIDNSVHLNKPVKLQEFTQVVRRLLATMPPTIPLPATPQPNASLPVIFIVDDDGHMREAMRHALDQSGWTIEDYATSEAFLAAYRPGREACLLLDAYLPGMSGLELLQQLRSAGDHLPAIMITGNSDVSIAVQAMKAGASDFIEKPVGRSDLLARIASALDQARDSSKRSLWQAEAASLLSDLTPRQRQIMDLVLAGHPSKNIAADLKISQRTVENHRAAIMQKSGTKSLPALARLALAAGRAV